MALVLRLGGGGVELADVRRRTRPGVSVGFGVSHTTGAAELRLGGLRPVEASDLRVGDHIVTSRLGYAHHGIYAGRSEVIHYHKPDGGPATIQRTSLATFRNGSTLELHRRAGGDGAEIVRRASQRIGEQGYDLFRNNCEHFAYDAFERT